MIRSFFRHPIILFSSGVIVGYVFTKQVGSIPGVSKIPQKS
jgi:hypothetical protein